MNEEKFVILKGNLQNKDYVLSHPEEYEEKILLCVEVKKEYLAELKQFVLDKKVNLGQLEVTLKPWPGTPTERAKHFFFMVRDRLAKHLNDETREHKEHLYHSCLAELKFMDRGRLKTSLTQLNKRELWLVTEQMYLWCEGAGVTMRDLETEWSELREDLKSEIERIEDIT